VRTWLWLRWLPSLPVLCAWAGCAHGAVGEPARVGRVSAHGLQYADDAGLRVTTVAASVEQPVTAAMTALAELLVDRIVVHRVSAEHTDVSGQASGHAEDDLDAVSGASVTVVHGGELDKLRWEGTLGARLEAEPSGTPVRVQAQGRASVEDDYSSLAAKLSAEAELFDRNTTLSAFTGYGHDVSDPSVRPPGEADDWPASHDRFTAGATASQLLGPRLVLSGGAATTLQLGTLQSPYRRALVRTTLFPERLPHRRVRATAFVSLAWYLGWGSALHLRPGVYLDSWGVRALIGELRLARDLGSRGLLALRYRYYGQGRAAFYAPRYPQLQAPRSGDPRLGRVTEHTPGVSADYVVWGQPEQTGAIAFGLGYDLAVLDQRSAARTSVAHVFALEASALY
jgi:hypothetical protein